MGLSNIIGFMNEPIPKFFFEVLFIDKFDFTSPLSMISATASLAMQAMDPVATAFSSVQGLKVAFETTPISEAGWSTPRPTFDKMVNDKLTLVRYLRPRHIGVMGFSMDPVSGWCQDTMQAAKTWEKAIYKKDILVFIYHPMIQNPLPVGPASFPVAGFMLQDAFPMEWGVEDLDSTAGDSPLKETIVFGYTEIKRMAIPPA